VTGVSAQDARRLALALPEAAEGDDHGTPAFTVGGKIFCTLGGDPLRATLKLTEEDQDNLVAGHPGVIEPVAGYWGRKGWTMAWCEKADAALISMLLKLAWAKVAPKRLLKAGS
jgi:hypothetical protein